MPLQLPPLSLYIHIPWCVRKCPYCDFNSHASKGELPVDNYVEALILDLHQDTHLAQDRHISSIFFGGGTPSLLPASAIGSILDEVKDTLGIEADAEITLEANPGTTEYSNLEALRATGVNRLSLGVQSFNNQHLNSLGRIHDAAQAKHAINKARQAGFNNFNLDLMHGLPDQTEPEALDDLSEAISLAPNHISWYQLTIEKNTEFYSRPPTLPSEDRLLDIQTQGHQHLLNNGYVQYETSAYAKPGHESKHNTNYWRFGDYLAIGAGAHGKITFPKSNEIMRYQKTRLPEHYLDPNRAFTSAKHIIERENLPLEFLMNALRLKQGVETNLLEETTGLTPDTLGNKMEKCVSMGLIEVDKGRIKTTEQGYRFLNTLLEIFV